MKRFVLTAVLILGSFIVRDCFCISQAPGIFVTQTNISPTVISGAVNFTVSSFTNTANTTLKGTLDVTGNQTNSGNIVVTGNVTSANLAVIASSIATSATNMINVTASTGAFTALASSTAKTATDMVNIYKSTGVILNTIAAVTMSSGAAQSFKASAADTWVIQVSSADGTVLVKVNAGSGGFYPAPKTMAQLKAMSPNAAGGIWYDSTNFIPVQSTGTGKAAFSIITSSWVLPTGW